MGQVPKEQIMSGTVKPPEGISAIMMAMLNGGILIQCLFATATILIFGGRDSH